MKTPARLLLFGAAFAGLLALMSASHAEDKPAPADQPAGDVHAAASTPVAPSQPTPETAPANPTQTTAPAEGTPAAEPALRRLDTAADKPAATKEQDTDDDEEVSADDTATPAPQAEEKPAPEKPGKKAKIKNLSFGYTKHAHANDPRVTIGGDSTLPEGEHADAVVSVFGSSTARGTVSDAVVSVLGSSTTSGEVGDAVVSILGDTRVEKGRVGQAAVAVAGNTYVNGHVGEQAVAVLGDVELGPDAEVDGDVVSVGGQVRRDPKAIVHGSVQNVAIGGHAGGVEWLHVWIAKCVLRARPLAFGEHLFWAWLVALGFLALYALIALIFGGAVEKCVKTLEERPGFSLLAAVLTVLITPVAIILLCVTVIGIALVPFIAAGLFFASIFGKVVMLAWIGRSTARLADKNTAWPAVLCVLAGGAIVLLLYTVPVLGFIVYKLLGVLGLGVVVYTIALGMKRKPGPPRPAPAAVPAGVPSAAAMAAVEPPVVAGEVSAPAPAGGEPAAAGEAPVPPVAPPMPPLVAVSAATLERAGFWIRVAASALDCIIVGLALGFLPHLLRPNFLLLFAGYCVVLWALKGTTVGGIVCNLKVVRLDDRPVDWMTALVRALSGFLSLFAAGLGFIWVAFDDQRQSWHDKIAGTTIVVVPKGVSLV